MIETNTRRGRGTSKENILKVKTLKFFLDWKESVGLSGKQIFEATKIAESTISRAISKDDMKLSMLADICAAFGSKLSMRITRNSKDITDIIVTNIRHYEALNRALEALNRVIDGLDTTIPADLIAQDLRECLYHLNDILGEVTTDEVLKTIFEHFCVGK